MSEVPTRIDEIFARAADTFGNAPHLVLGDGTVVRYEESYARALRLASALSAAGVAAGDRVAAFMRNSREFTEFAIACGISGAIGVALNTLSTRHEIARILADCTPAAVIVEGSFVERFPGDAFPGDTRVKLATKTKKPPPGWLSYDEGIARDTNGSTAKNAASNDAALMIYSSGTTGLPKGILLGHGALVENARMVADVLEYRPDDRFLTVLPLFSSFGFAFDFLQAGLVGASTAILEQFDAREAAARIERDRVTVLAGVPTMLANMFDSSIARDFDLSSLRLIDVGGGPVSPRLKTMLKDDYGIEVVESYGLTEISPVASVQVPGGDNPGGSCGPPLPGIEVRVVGRDSADVPAGEPGELLFRGPTLMLGYWGQPELTEEALKGGWLHTGDIGRLDEAGNIYILDRTKDMIVANGFNVFPKEVENAIAELDGVRSVAVVGIPHEIQGETIHAFIVPSGNGDLTEERVLDHCKEHLAHFKRPKSVKFVTELPLTGSGKIRRFKLREQLQREGDEASHQ